ncbi:MAG: methyltransferase domain-containing protein [Candidatus Eisenbacteria bacterium]|nr:methyltransferase domain-containing protein [Candidatus Eisenbacteria bacterium]
MRSERVGRWREILPSGPWARRKAALRVLFEEIAPDYDRLNHLLSFGLDRRWRARAAREAIGEDEPGTVLDLASGTGDQASALIKRSSRIRLLRVDISLPLLARATEKLRGERRGSDGVSAPEQEALFPSGIPVVAEMESLPLRPGSCKAITMAFALRHVESLDRLLAVSAEALEPGGRLAFVDMSLPASGAWAAFYRFYFVRCLPRIARLFGGEKEAYDLMVRSVLAFPGWEALEGAARGAGLREVRTIALTGGAARILTARR